MVRVHQFSKTSYDPTLVVLFFYFSTLVVLLSEKKTFQKKYLPYANYQKNAGLYNPRLFRSLVGLGLELLSKGNESESR